MRPELFHIGPIPVYSFGLMMALAFLTANALLNRELRRRWRNEERAAAFSSTITLIALVAGVAGSKLFHLLENPGLLLRNGLSEVFSGSGLTFFGGLLMAIGCIHLYVRRKGIPFLFLADVTAPGLILAYGIGRIGCQLAGDGDYGIPSTLPWAMSYPDGTVPTLSALNPELASKWMEMNPGLPVPVDITVHPTPVYETLTFLLIFVFVYRLQQRLPAAPQGQVFGWYLVGAGCERLLVEFLRLNPLYGGLSQAQWISIGLMLAGVTILVRSGRRSDAVSA
ncbi:MAG: prolipoprotein diacylglyceryl transferase [Candidatus Kapaibacterium sp.]